MYKYRSSRLEVFSRKGGLRNFAKFTGKHLCQNLFFNKVAGQGNFSFWEQGFIQWNEKEFKQRMRVSRQIFKYILTEIGEYIQKNSHKPKPCSYPYACSTSFNFVSSGTWLYLSRYSRDFWCFRTSSF